MDYTHRADLVDPEVVKRLCERRDTPAALRLASHFGAILATGWLLHAAWATPWAVPVFVLHGMLLNYLYAAQHEMMHFTAFRTRWINDWASRLTGFLIVQPRDYDRLRHYEHHKHTSIPGKDPELDGLNPRELSRSLGGYLWRLSCVPYWTTRVRSLARMTLGDTRDVGYLPPAKRALLVHEARWHAGGYAAVAVASVAAGSLATVAYWLAPLVLTKFTHEVHNMIEHGELPLVTDMLDNTRSVRTNAFMRWICWNMPYHCEHHLFAAVPFYNLPRLHRLVEPALRVQGMGYLAFHREVLRRAWENSRRAHARPA